MNLSTTPHKNIQNWLFFTAAMVFAMAVIGAITRLTESGLSMVEWKPLIGAIPPLNEAEWNRVFDLYQQTPEFQHKNSWMGLEDFKNIFFWEWFHRLWGRLIGLVFALPLLWFWIKKQIPQGYGLKFLGLLALGGSQGALGWYMVKSGLIDRPDVSHFRLAAHLGLALFIYVLLLWCAFDFFPRKVDASPSTFCQKRHGWVAFAFIATTILWGAFVAGLDGGMLYNTWPKMDTYWIPPEVTGLFAILHDPGAVQFFHRTIAIVTMAVVLSFGWRMKNFPLMLMVFFQVGLGIATVLTQVVIPIAALHQAGALILLGLMVKQMHALHRCSAQTCAA
jgi:cytochrome c oxidase assembly protein subunit 15